MGHNHTITEPFGRQTERAERAFWNDPFSPLFVSDGSVEECGINGKVERATEELVRFNFFGGEQFGIWRRKLRIHG